MSRVAIAVVLIVFTWNSVRAADDPARLEWNVEEVTREALVYASAAAKSTPSPVVFCFHGHGGRMKHAAATFAYHTHWPQAIAVYMQGLNTPGVLTDPEGKKPGWQKTFGDQGDRDLKFFDAVLATLKKDYKVDDTRILVIDLRDKLGFDLASRLDPKTTEQVRDECNRRGVIPTAILAISLPTAVKVIGFMTTSGRETLQRPLPEGMFWVVGISAGGNSYGMLSIPDAPVGP